MTYLTILKKFRIWSFVGRISLKHSYLYFSYYKFRKYNYDELQLGQLFPFNDNQIENKFLIQSIGSWTIIHVISSHNFEFEVQSLKLLYLANVSIIMQQRTFKKWSKYFKIAYHVLMLFINFDNNEWALSRDIWIKKTSDWQVWSLKLIY